MQKHRNCNNCDVTITYTAELNRKAQLNKVIVNKNNSPDYLAINIYFDTLRSWYVPKKTLINGQDGEKSIVSVNKLKTKGIFLCYSKLSKNHGASKETIRKKLVKLEELGLIKRSFQHNNNVTTNSYNRLIIYVWKDTPHFYNKYGISFNDVTNLTPQTNHEYIAKKHSIKYISKGGENLISENRGGIHKLEDTKELRINSKEFIYRSKKSNIKNNKLKKLEDYYPLTKEDCYILQKMSGREFSLNAMNEILKSLINKSYDREFKTKKGFISYMSKVFAGELRDAVKISNETFKIKINISEDEEQMQVQEKYLAKIELSKDTSKETQLKKKLANILKTSRAYQLLQSYRKYMIQDNKFVMILNQNMDIDQQEKQNILQEIQSIYNSYAGDRMLKIQDIEFRILNNYNYGMNKNEKIEVMEYRKKSSCKKQMPETIWGRVRSRLIKEYGESMDTAWFSKIESEENKQEKTISLKAKSGLVEDWINSNYMQKIEKIISSIGFKNQGFVC